MLTLAARHGRYLLLGGLVAGVALPGLARLLAGPVPELVTLLLFLNAFRSGPKLLTSFRQNPLHGTGLIIALQLALPLAILAAVMATLGEVPAFWLATILMLSSPSLSGNPNFVAMLGHDPASTMRLLVIGTLLFPAIAFVTLWALPGIDGQAALTATIRLAVTILGIATCGILARRLIDSRAPGFDTETLCDGASAMLLTVVVIGLMAEVGPLFRTNPGTLALWLAAVMALNLVLQLVTLTALRRLGHPEQVAGSVIAGNRNTVLYLIALPPEITAAIMLFIGCYQIPMYLTPVILRRLHAPRA